MSPAYVTQERPGANLNPRKEVDEHKCRAMGKGMHMWKLAFHGRIADVQTTGRPVTRKSPGTLESYLEQWVNLRVSPCVKRRKGQINI